MIRTVDRLIDRDGNLLYADGRVECKTDLALGTNQGCVARNPESLRDRKPCCTAKGERGRQVTCRVIVEVNTEVSTRTTHHVADDSTNGGDCRDDASMGRVGTSVGALEDREGGASH